MALGVGIDSGGTHTTVVLNRGQGPVHVEAAEVAVSISRARGDIVSRDAATWICRFLAAQPDDELTVWVGAAGYSGASAAWIKEIFDAPLRDLARCRKHIDMFIANDGVSILKSPPLFGRGVAAIVGTGSVVMGAHPLCPDGVVKRGGSEWLVSDEGAGVWMTIQAIKLLLKDIQMQGAVDYQSPLLDRLCDYFGVESEWLLEVPPTHRGLARAELLAHVVSEGRTDSKRRIAGFVYPHLFDLATLRAGRPHDQIAATVLAASVSHISSDIASVAEVLAAHTADAPQAREKLPLVVGGNIAAQADYSQQLLAAVSGAKYIESVTQVGDASEIFAALAWHYSEASSREQRAIARSFDPLHSILKLA